MKEVMFPDDGDRLMTIAETAKRLGTSPVIVSRFLNAGLLTYLTFGRCRRIRKYTFNKFLAKYDGQDLLQVLEEREG